MSQRTHQLVLDSRDRINYPISSSHDCQLRIKPSIKGFNKVELLGMQIIETSYNITSANNRVSFTVGGTNYVVAIDPTSYSPCTLAAELKRIMEAASAETFTIYYDTGYFKFGFTIDSAPSFQFNWAGLVNSAGYILGFTGFDTGVTKTIYSVVASSLNLPPYYYVQIMEFGSHTRSSHENDWATFCIMNTGNGGDILNHTMFSTYQLLEYFGSSELSTVNVRIKTRDNNYVDLNNSDWFMLLRLHYPDGVEGIGV